jgi:hypothetical protein
MTEPPPSPSNPPPRDGPQPEDLESRVRELEETLQEITAFLAPWIAADAAAIRGLVDPD